jgi:hypothetical protein
MREQKITYLPWATSDYELSRSKSATLIGYYPYNNFISTHACRVFFRLTPQQLIRRPPQRLVAKRHQPTVQGKVYEWLCHV